MSEKRFGPGFYVGQQMRLIFGVMILLMLAILLAWCDRSHNPPLTIPRNWDDVARRLGPNKRGRP